MDALKKVEGHLPHEQLSASVQAKRPPQRLLRQTVLGPFLRPRVGSVRCQLVLGWLPSSGKGRFVTDTARGTQLGKRLQKLATFSGVRRTNLLEVLGEELCKFWHIRPDDPLATARAKAQWQLERLISSQLSDDRDKLKARVSYNLSSAPIPDSARATESSRHTWMQDNRGGISYSEARKDLRNYIIPVFVRSLLSEAAPRTPPEVLGPQPTDDPPPTDETSTSRTDASTDDPPLIDRREYMDVIQAYIDADQLLVCIWGEPGTGKTVLAEQVVRTLAQNEPVVRLRAADPDILRDDIVDLLIAEGMEPTNWSEPYSHSMLRRALESLPRCKAVILDNVDDEELIWRLVPKSPHVPVLITMRNEPQTADIKKLELHDFTEQQACIFIDRYLNDLKDKERLALARVLGCRPLALDHAVRFVRYTDSVTVHDLIVKLATSVAEGLDLLTHPADHTRNLVILYKLILEGVAGEPTTQHVLDSFLAIAGKGGMEDRDLLYFFMQSGLGGASDPIRFNSGLRALAVRGLLREERHQGRRNGDRLLVMHPLTYDLLRDLRAPVPFEIEYRYLEFLTSDEVEESFTGSISSGIAHAWLRRQLLGIASKLDLPHHWKSFSNIDDRTWIAVCRQDEKVVNRAGEIVVPDYIIRYELYPGYVYKLDYRTGERHQLDPLGFEAQQLRRMTLLFHEATKSFFEELQEKLASTNDPPEGEPASAE